MPEGDTIFRTAQTLHRVFAGQVVTRFATVLPHLTRIDDDQPLAGRTITSVTSRGKHILMAFSGDLTLRTHMRMNGSWHVYPIGVRWRRPGRDMRVLVETARAVAVGFNIPEAEFLTARQLSRHRQLTALGSDLLSATFDAEDVARRMRQRGNTPVGDVLLNQRVVAGIGNVFKSEILFLARVDPFTPVCELSDQQLARVIETARDQLRANVLSPAQMLSLAQRRRTTRSLDPNAELWVYRRAGRPCRGCGAPIQSRAIGPDARLTYWCPRCQRGSPDAA